MVKIIESKSIGHIGEFSKHVLTFYKIQHPLSNLSFKPNFTGYHFALGIKNRACLAPLENKQSV